jgi:hypothetical protein
VSKNFPTLAWRHSTPSIRKIRDRFAAWCRKPAVAAAAEAAEVAEAAEAAEVAGAAAVAAAAAAFPGADAAFAKPAHALTPTTQIVMAGFDRFDPAISCFLCNAGHLFAVVRARDGEVDH